MIGPELILYVNSRIIITKIAEIDGYLFFKLMSNDTEKRAKIRKITPKNAQIMY